MDTISDAVRTFSVEEERRLVQNLLQLATAIHQGDLKDRNPSIDLLSELHRGLFNGVRDHAGKIRQPGFGSEFLTFGPNRSLSSHSVPDELLDLFKDFQRELASLEARGDSPGFEEAAIFLAAHVHAEIIRIHPFEDGNGRSSRLLLNWTLVHLGIRPIAFEATKEEYCDCLNHYFRGRDIGPLVDLCLRLAGERL